MMHFTDNFNNLVQVKTLSHIFERNFRLPVLRVFLVEQGVDHSVGVDAVSLPVDAVQAAQAVQRRDVALGLQVEAFIESLWSVILSLKPFLFKFYNVLRYSLGFDSHKSHLEFFYLTPDTRKGT